MSKRTGPGGVLLAATSIAATTKTAIATTITAGGNCLNLYATVGTATCGTLKFFADISNDGGATWFTSPKYWLANGGAATAAASYFVPLDGLNVAIGDKVRISYQASDNGSSPTLAVDYEFFDSGAAGSTASSSGAGSYPGPLPVTDYWTATDSSFVVGDSPATVDINAGLGRNAVAGYIANRGAGNISMKIDDGSGSYGAAIILESGDVFSFAGLSVDRLELTHVADSAYDVFAV